MRGSEGDIMTQAEAFAVFEDLVQQASLTEVQEWLRTVKVPAADPDELRREWKYRKGEGGNPDDYAENNL
jgi:hypothetical protein